MEVSLRWMKRADLDVVRGIHLMVGDSRPSEFIEEEVKKSNSVCIVAEAAGRIVAFMFYEMRPTMIKMTYIAVDPTFKRKGVGTALVSKLISKLNEKRSRLVFFVSEYNLDVQLFLRDLGFKAVQVKPREGGGCDYKFQYELNKMVIA
jgi:[ribosomal protein S18]-alanine N-acetyltransferase